MKFLRHEAKLADDWIRFEAEFKGSYAHQLTEAIRNCKTDEDLKNTIINSILNRYSLYYTKSNKPHLTTRMMTELLDKNDFQFISPSPRLNKLEQSLDYLMESSGLFPVLWKVDQVWGNDTSIELIKFLIDSYKDKFKPNQDHIFWVSKYTEIYRQEGKPWVKD